MRANSLKACPFCGAAAKTVTRDKFYREMGSKFYASVRCSNHRCAARPVTDGATLSAASRRWNRRAAPQPEDAQ